MSRSKRLETGTLTRPLSFGATTGWPGSDPYVQLIHSLTLFLLMANIIPNHRLISTHRRNKIPAHLKMLTHEITLPFTVSPCNMDRALALDVTHHTRHCVLRRYRNQHMNMVPRVRQFIGKNRQFRNAAPAFIGVSAPIF